MGDLIGVDVGGTFTDLVRLDQKTGKVRLSKVASTLENQAFGVMHSLAEAETNLNDVALVVHGTTTTTNAVLERKLSLTGLITTAGFRDVLELGRRTRPQPYGMKGHFLPIIPRDLRFEIGERMDYGGRVLSPLDECAVRVAGKRLLDLGVEAVVVHFYMPMPILSTNFVRQKYWPNSGLMSISLPVIRCSRKAENLSVVLLRR